MTSLAIFVSVKLLALAFYAFLWVVPFAIVWVLPQFWNKERHKILVAKILWPISIPFLVAWIGLMWPASNPGPMDMATDLYEKVTESYGEYKQAAVKKQPVVRTELGTEVRRVMLVDWAPPKHFYVSMKELQTGKIWERVYVSKHCDTGGLKKGDEYNLTVRKYSLSNRPGEVFWEFDNLYGAFCGR